MPVSSPFDRVLRATTVSLVLGAAQATAAPRPPPPPPLYHYVALASSVNDVSADGMAVGLMSGDAACPSATGSVAVIFGPLSATTTGPVAPSFVDPIGPRPERSYAWAVSADGTMAAGVAAMPDFETADACDNVDGVAVWEPCGSTWCRSWVEPPSGGGHRARDVEWVADTPVVIGDYDGAQSVWRRIDGAWQREELGIPAGEAAPRLAHRIQGGGLMIAWGAPAGSWDCSGASCHWLGRLSSVGLSSPGSAAGINSAGDIVGQGVPSGGSVARAIVWRYAPTPAGPAWSAPQVLPDFGFGARAQASEWGDGTLTVVGQVQPRRSGSMELRTWTWTGSSWSAPVRLGDQDDSTASVGGFSYVRMSAEGDVVHQGSNWVEVRLP